MQSDTNNDPLGGNALAAWIAELSPAATPGQCLNEAKELGETVAALAWTAPQMAPPARLRERLLAQVAQVAGPSPSINQKPLPAANLLTMRAAQGEWKPLAPDISVKQLFVDEKTGVTTALYRFAPGAVLGPHRHNGHEQCYVLEGDFYTGGQALGAGDFQCARPGSVHQPSRTVNGALVLIVAPAGYDPVA